MEKPSGTNFFYEPVIFKNYILIQKYFVKVKHYVQNIYFYVHIHLK